MNINGQSQEGSIINGNFTNWIFRIQDGIKVTITNLTLKNGNNVTVTYIPKQTKPSQQIIIMVLLSRIMEL
jgi:hypothetical protein